MVVKPAEDRPSDQAVDDRIEGHDHTFGNAAGCMAAGIKECKKFDEISAASR